MSALDKQPRRRPASVTPQVVDCLNVWQRFIERYPKETICRLSRSGRWNSEQLIPTKTRRRIRPDYASLCWYKGSHRQQHPRSACRQPYARSSFPCPESRKTGFPTGKSNSSVRTVRFTQTNQSGSTDGCREILRFPSSLQKLEWNCKGGARDIWQYVIQFRASGVRVKRPTSSPSLIAMTSTQVPIIAWERRYMTPANAPASRAWRA